MVKYDCIVLVSPRLILPEYVKRRKTSFVCFLMYAALLALQSI